MSDEKERHEKEGYHGGTGDPPTPPQPHPTDPPPADDDPPPQQG